jgi:uncharacterized metal-binding protein
MPSGKTHDRITLWLLPLLISLSLLITRSSRVTLISSTCFIFSGLMFGPDLDIYSVQFKRWGKLSLIWLPYQKVLRHRSKLSHGFLLGTIIRLIYLSIWVAVGSIFLVAIAQVIWGFEWNWQKFLTEVTTKIVSKYPIEAIAFFCGLELGAMSHYLADGISTTYKKYQKEGIKGFIQNKSKPKPRRRKKRISSIPKSKNLK